MPDYRPSLGGALRELGELRWMSNKKQHRLIGYFDGDTFIAVLGCTHKQKRYDPADALDTAARRKRQIETGEGTTCEYAL